MRNLGLTFLIANQISGCLLAQQAARVQVTLLALLETTRLYYRLRSANRREAVEGRLDWSD